jgi:hypothetical protein
MTNINFPSNITPPAWPFECEYENNSLITKFEDGSQQSRRKFTRSRRKWTLKWNHIPRSEYLTLMTFISQTVSFSARSFNWVNTDSLDDAHPETVEVRITHVGKWTNDALHYWSGTIELTEV